MKTITGSLVMFLMFCAFATSDQAENGTPLHASMSGALEAPGPGDPDGSGTFYMELNQGQGTITYELTVDGIDPATAAHIHIGNPGVPGPVVIPLQPPTGGSSSGTIMNIDKEVIKAIRQNPGAYYVNVHNPAYPAGAVRGQLEK